MRRSEPKTKNEFFYYDLAALALGLALTVFFALTAKNCVGVTDESFYYSVTQRLFLGEKLIADEWNIAQLVHLLNVIPYYVYTRITGGTEGILLFMRYLFIAINAVFYGYTYIKLRRYRGWGIAAAFLFCALIPQTVMSVTYFTAAPMAILAFCLILMCSEKEPGIPKLLFCGVLLACAVLAEPYLIAGFALWFVTVIVRAALRKKEKPFLADYGFITDPRVFFTVSAGAAAVFLPFMIYMVVGGSFARFGEAFPYLASGGEIGKLGSVLLKKWIEAIRYFGAPFMIGLAAVPLCAAVLRIRKKTDVHITRILLACACVCLAGCHITAGIGTLADKGSSAWVAFAEYHCFPLLLFSATPLLLSDKKEPRITAFWATGAVFTLLVDASSAVFLASGGGLMRAACFMKLAGMIPAPADAPQPKKKTKKTDMGKSAQIAVKIAAAVCVVAAVLWHGGFVLCETVYKPMEKLLLHKPEPLSCEIEKGPFKGLRTTPDICAAYTDTLEDLDGIVAAANGAPVAVPDVAPYTYLYMGLPYGSYTAWFEFYEIDRLAAYWQLRPAQQPAYIYVPYYQYGLFTERDAETRRVMLDRLFEWIDGEVTEGKAGYTVKVTKIRSPFAQTGEN